MTKKRLTAVILAGGRGTRLGELTEETPKPLITVNDKQLLSYGVGFAHALGASRIIISASYMTEKLDEARKKFKIETVLVTDRIFQPGKRILGILAARDLVEGDLVIFDADYIFHKDIADAVRRGTYADMTVHAADSKSPWMAQDVIARFTDQYRLIDMIKTEGTQKNLSANELYFNSLLYCPAHVLEDFFSAAECAAAIEGPGGQHLEDAVLVFNRNKPVRVRNLGTPLWVEIDTPTELDAAHRFVATYADFIPYA